MSKRFCLLRPQCLTLPMHQIQYVSRGGMWHWPCLGRGLPFHRLFELAFGSRPLYVARISILYGIEAYHIAA